jgi:hypothetical protein
MISEPKNMTAFSTREKMDILAARLGIVPSTLNTTTENKETKCKTMKSVTHNAAGSLVRGRA